MHNLNNVKEYEEACEQRKDKGTANMIISGFTVFAGTLAIIGTAGMATPNKRYSILW